MTVSLQVLLVEDSENDALLLVETLREGGFAPRYLRVETEAAYRTALTEQTWDVIIADYVLPRFSGIAAIRIVREIGIDIPIIMVSGKAGEETAVEAMRAGAHDYLLKGNLARLVPAIQRELQEAQTRRERRQAEEALSEALSRAQQYLDVAGVMMLALDRDGRVTLINRKGLEILGCAEEEIIGKVWSDHFVPAGVREEVWGNFRQLIAGQLAAVEYFENPVVNCNGEERLLAFHNTVLRDEDGQIIGTLSSGEDITERKQAEEALRESEALFRSLAENANAIIGIIQGGKFAYVNPFFSQLSGYSRDELLAMNISQIVAPAWRALVLKRMRSRITGDRSFPSRYDIAILDKDGREHWLDFSAARTEYHGKPTIVGIAYEITERKQAEEERGRLLNEVQRRVAELDATLNAVADGLIIFSPAGEILLDNAAAQRLLDGVLISAEYSEARPEWLSLFAHTPAGKRLTTDNAPGARAARGETVIGEVLVFPHKDGTETWASVTAAPIRQRGDAIIGVVSTYTDITQLHNLQEQQKVFVHMVSHDLRAPLTAIQGHAQLLLEALQAEHLDAEKLFSTEAILRSAQRMNVMIQDLVDAARLEGKQLELKKQAVALSPYLTDLLERSEMVFTVERIQVEIPPDSRRSTPITTVWNASL